MSRITGRLTAYAAGAVLVRLADEGARVALTLLSLQRTGSAASGGLLIAALLAPHVVAAPAVGFLADRTRHPQRLSALAGLGFAGSLATAAAALGRAPVLAVAALLLVGGCCGPALTGVLSSQLPRLTSVAALPRAFGLDSLTYNVSGIVGPAAAAVIAAQASPAASAYGLAACAAVGAALIGLLPVSARLGPSGTDGDGLPGVVRLLRRDRVLATVTAATCVAHVGAGALPVVAAVLADRRYGAVWAGGLLTVMAAAALVGSVVWTWRPAPAATAPRVVLLSLVGVGLPLAAAAVSPSLPVLVGLFALSGLCDGPLFGALLLTREQQSPPHLRGQVFALGAGAKITAAAAGAAFAGAVSGAPAAVQLLLAGAWPVLAGGVGLAVLRSTVSVAAR